MVASMCVRVSQPPTISSASATTAATTGSGFRPVPNEFGTTTRRYSICAYDSVLASSSSVPLLPLLLLLPMVSLLLLLLLLLFVTMRCTARLSQELGSRTARAPSRTGRTRLQTRFMSAGVQPCAAATSSSVSGWLCWRHT